MRQVCEKEYTCAVLNLNEKKQIVYYYRAPEKTRAPPCIEGPERSESGSETAQILDDGEPGSPARPESPRTRKDCGEVEPGPVSSDEY